MYSGKWYFDGEANYACFNAQVRVSSANDIEEAIEIMIQAGYDRVAQISEQCKTIDSDQWTWIDLFGECSSGFLYDYGIYLETDDDFASEMADDVDAVFDSQVVILEIVENQVITYEQEAMPKEIHS